MTPKVLIVEDNQTVVNLYRNTLGGAGFTVQAALDGRAGLEAVKTFAPDVILLDLMLPVVDGLTILRRLRADEQYKSLPIVVFSNAFTGDKLSEVWNAGATQVLSKANTSPKLVVEAIKAALAGRSDKS